MHHLDLHANLAKPFAFMVDLHYRKSNFLSVVTLPFMQRKHLTNQITSKQGVLCLMLLLVALVFSNMASLKMTLDMLPSGSEVGSMSMAHADTDSKEHQHCQADQASSCQMSDVSHDHQGCTQAHCSTLPVLSTAFNVVAVARSLEQQFFPTPRMLPGESNTPYIPPIA